jgi:hypothetical protein
LFMLSLRMGDVAVGFGLSAFLIFRWREGCALPLERVLNAASASVHPK